jgi:hypothetical protein
MTTFENKCAILADLWINFRYEEEYKDIIAYNDLGFPFAYAVDSGIIDSNERVSSFIDEAWTMLLSAIGTEDTGFETLDDMLVVE